MALKSNQLSNTLVIFQYIYKSAASKAFTTDDLIKLLRLSNNKNYLQKLSGILVYHDGQFMQLLEGDKGAIETLVDKIRADTRNHDLTPVYSGFAEKRSMPSWAMAFVTSEEFPVTQSSKDFSLSLSEAKEILSMLDESVAKPFTEFIDSSR